jgi:16S rRNA (adenine(1408)-N(1))-methyltransferase
LLGRLALERAPGELRGLADRLTVLLPWGSLLRAVTSGDEASLRRLRGLCAPGARVEIVVGDGDDGLPSPDGLPERYREAGFEVAAERVPAAEVAALGTTWAKRLAGSSPDRSFWRLSGVATAAQATRPGSAPRTAS